MASYYDNIGAQGAQGPQGPQGNWDQDDPPRHWRCPHCEVRYDWEAHPREVAQYVDNEPGIPHIECPSCRRCMGCKH